MLIDRIIKKFMHIDITEDELLEARKILRIEYGKRNSFFLRKGEHSSRVGFLIEGLLYAYSIDSNGEEQIHNFFYPSFPHDVLFNYEAHIQVQSSQVAYKFYQDSTIVVLDTAGLKKLYEKFPRFYSLEMLIMQPQFLQATYQNKLLRAGKALEKIAILKRQSPEIFKLFPSAYIASYLGIHRNTFNRAMHKL
ncbi:Crp/Fnr family transcriptional regulator [Sphingobacterium paludis]|nr:Crp/Fnr family transcriptional regulator [Sphingobacterium paludis]